MDWIINLFTNTESVAHIALLYAIVIAVGVYLGKIKIGGISLGVTFVLFAGILAGHVIRLAWQRIPHLGLAALLTLLLGNLIVRMHLDRKVGVGVDKLDEQRELIAKTLVVFGSK